jgi:mannose-6-phosphate isomerase-like protein (cupin superfamily)
MIFHVSEVPAYEAPGAGKRVIRYLIEAERTSIQRFIVGLTTLEPGQKSEMVSHEPEEVFFILEGRALMHVGDEHREVGPETMIVIEPNKPHQILALGDTPVRFLFVESPPPPDMTAKRLWKRID